MKKLTNTEIKNILWNHSIETFTTDGRIYGIVYATQFNKDGTRHEFQEITNLTGYTVKQLRHYLCY
jgi:hypothetical protein